MHTEGWVQAVAGRQAGRLQNGRLCVHGPSVGQNAALAALASPHLASPPPPCLPAPCPSPPAANIFIGSLIFIEELADKIVEAVGPARDTLDACLIFPSMPAVMKLNKLGTFSMSQLGGGGKSAIGEPRDSPGPLHWGSAEFCLVGCIGSLGW
jgi:hypothetical protein